MMSSNPWGHKAPAPPKILTKLFRLREEKGLERYEVCRACNVNPNQYNQIEAGKYPASRPHQGRLAEFFELPIREIFLEGGWAAEAEAQ